MKEIDKKIVFSYDIKRILNGINAFDYKYDGIPSEDIINDLRNNFKLEANKIFNNNIAIIYEDEMLAINNLIGGWYPHCYIR